MGPPAQVETGGGIVEVRLVCFLFVIKYCVHDIKSFHLNQFLVHSSVALTAFTVLCSYHQAADGLEVGGTWSCPTGLLEQSDRYLALLTGAQPFAEATALRNLSLLPIHFSFFLL